MTKRLSICGAFLLLAGCDPRTNVSPPDVNAKMADQLSYFRDRHGVCYAAISSTSYSLHQIISIASIPCEKVNL